jgi:hypothetical protein
MANTRCDVVSVYNTIYILRQAHDNNDENGGGNTFLVRGVHSLGHIWRQVLRYSVYLPPPDNMVWTAL